MKCMDPVQAIKMFAHIGGGMPDENRKGNPLAEVEALQKVAAALGDLEPDEAGRVIRWASERFGGGAVEPSNRSRGSAAREEKDREGVARGLQFDDVADLYAAASPESESDRALVVGYWLQYHENLEEFDSQRLNTQLKNLGHGVGNITQALERLKSQKPQLAIQTRKAGTSQQARKKYKLTVAGKHAVEEMVRKESDE
jgi:hypothetical protein